MGMQNVVEIVEHEDYAILYPRGYLNGPLGQQIDSACGELIQKGLGRIVISFEHTETMNTMGVASLVSILEKVARRDGVICFTNLLSTNRQILDVLDISRAVLIFEDEEDAFEHLRTSA